MELVKKTHTSLRPFIREELRVSNVFRSDGVREHNSAILSLLEWALLSDKCRDFIIKGMSKYIFGRKSTFFDPYSPPQVQQDKRDIMLALLRSFQRGMERQQISRNVLHIMLRCMLANYLDEMQDKGSREAAVHFAETHGGRKRPAFLVISPTKACNLRCAGCYATAEAGAEGMDWEVFNRIITEAKRLWGMRFFVFSGGEPFAYRSHGKGVLEMARENRDCFFLCYTNGTLIDEELAGHIADTGNLTPAISVEGFEELTDKRRGAGVFQKILAAMGHLRRAGVPFGLSLTATRENAEEILSDAFIHFFFEEQQAMYGWLFQYMPIGKAYTLDLLVTPEQRLWMWKRTWALIRERKLMLADFWNCATVTEGCIAACARAGYCYIDWNGKVMPCVFVPYAAGNIHDIYKQGGSVDDIYELPYFRAIRRWQRDYALGQDGPQKHGNWLLPCSLRDHHSIGRTLIETYHPEPEDQAAAAALRDAKYRDGMIDYDQRLERLFDPIWQKEYLSGAGRGEHKHH